MADEPVLKRTCACGCRRKFSLKDARDQKRFFDRQCAAKFNAKMRPKTSKKRIQKKSGVRDRGLDIGQRDALTALRKWERRNQQ